MKLWFASFDIGKKNFAFSVEEVDVDALRQLDNIVKKERYEEDGRASPKFEKLLQDVSATSRVVCYKNSDLTFNCDNNKNKRRYLDPEVFHNMVDLLDRYGEYWDRCSAFIIEKQMSFGKCRNPMAMKLGQHCYSYFTIRYGRYKQVVEFPAYYKTQILGAPKVVSLKNKRRRMKAMSKPQRKKWCVVKAYEVLERRGEGYIFKEASCENKKMDDICDCLLQFQAFLYLCFVEELSF